MATARTTTTPAHPGTADAVFKKHVADIGMKYAREHRMCGVAQECLIEIGVGEFLPATWVLQSKPSRTDAWRDRDCGTEKQMLTEMNVKIKSRVQDAIRNLHQPYIDLRDPKITEERAVKNLKTFLATRDKAVKAAEKDAYPIFRVIKRPDGSRRNATPTEIIKTENEPPVKPRKTAAKKTAARRTLAH